MRFQATLLLCLVWLNHAHAQIAINEVMPVNNVTIADDDGDYESWLELYNHSDDPVELDGYGLSNTAEEPWAWVFPEVTIQPGEYMLIWLSGKDRRQPGEVLHANFSPETEPGTLLLSSLHGTQVDEVELPDIPADLSWGRYPDGTGIFHIFQQPTPGGPNSSEHFNDILSPPGFNIHPGFYGESLQLELSHSVPDVTIQYTTDGSIPDDSSKIYDGPVALAYRGGEANAHSMIRTTPPEGEDQGYGWFPPAEPIDKGHTIRAVAVKSGYLPSSPATGTWFPGMEQQDLTVLSITAPGAGFFDSRQGIYVPGAIYDSLGFGAGVWGSHANYFERGDKWERAASIEWFEDGQRLFQQDIGVRIHGSGSRALPQKSLRLYARSDYGQTHFRHQVFPDEPYSEFKRLILRNSGQDFFRRTTMFRDAFMQRLVSGLNIDTQAYHPAVLYLNGEYWGIHNFRERYDKHYFERVHEVPEEYLDLLERNHTVKEGSNEHYLAMLEYIEHHDLSDPAHLDHISGLMDVDNFIDNNILQIFFRNTDWPGNNNDYWRYSGPPNPHIPEHDGRWRWVVLDLDFGFGLQTGHGSWEFDMLKFLLDPDELTHANQPWATFLIRSLLKNHGFRKAFIRRFSDLLNTTFRPDAMNGLIDEMADVVRPEMERHIQRWSHPPTLRNWEQHVDLMKDFSDKRPDHQIQHLQTHFHLEDPVEVDVLFPEEGTGIVHLNSLEIGPHLRHESDGHQSGPSIHDVYRWSGSYFPDIPIELHAAASAGYRFSHWEINGDTIPGSRLEINPVDRTVILPRFHPVDHDDHVIPRAFTLSESTSFQFNKWSPDEPAGTYPENMAFVYMDEIEPSLDAGVAGFTLGRFGLSSRTRISGLGDDGFAFINTSNLDGNPGYPGRRLGGALLALNTMDVDQVHVSWTAGTVIPNSREYGIRLQYRIGNQGPFFDITDSGGAPVAYVRSDSAGHRSAIGPVTLPGHVAGHRHVELLWRYYHTGMRHDEASGARSKLNISSIMVFSSRQIGDGGDDPELPIGTRLDQNYPNPFNEQTRIPFHVTDESRVAITVYDITGRKVARLVDDSYPSGSFTVTFDGSSLASGVYIFRMVTSSRVLTRKMVLIK